MTKRATMIDIAQRAGVSQATVSLVLGDVANARIAQETRDKVRAIADEMGYVRKPGLARNSDVKVIGLLIDEVMATPFAAQFIEGARLEAARQGALISVFCTGGNAQVEAAALTVLQAAGAVGVLYTSLVTRTVRPPPQLLQMPTILLNCHAPAGQFTSVVPADVTGAYAATQALIDAGHRRIAHIAGESWGEAARDRTLGYRRALASHDIVFDAALLVAPAWTVASGRELTLHLLDLPRPPTAIFCFSDRVALGCYEALAERGLQVGADVSVVGFDNDDLAVALRPPLSTMVLPHEEMARVAVASLCDQVASGGKMGISRVKIDCDLIARGSISPPRFDQTE